jgi:hypothetical protein
MNTDIGYDHKEYRQEVAPAGFVRAETRPDWQGLRARLGAAHAARRILLDDVRVLHAKGSFDRACAHALTSLGHDLPDVNPDHSEVGNLPGANAADAAGRQIAGGRG